MDAGDIVEQIINSQESEEPHGEHTAGWFGQKYVNFGKEHKSNSCIISFSADPNRNENNLISFLMARSGNANVLPSDFGYVICYVFQFTLR